MRQLRNSFRLQNTDPRWFRDKYLTAVTFVCFLVGMSLVWGWPPPRQDMMRGVRFLGFAALCILISPQRYIIVAGTLAIISIRGIVGLALYHSVPDLAVALVAGIFFYFLATRRGVSLSPAYKVNDYSYAELCIDVVILGSALLLYSKFS
jgi:hypothetical protein